MSQIVVGVFADTDAARSAERALIDQGIKRSAVHLLASDAASVTSDQVYAPDTGSVRAFFDNLFGTGNAQETDLYAEAIRHGRVMLAVDLAAAGDLDPVRDAMADAGALDIGHVESGG